MLALTDHDTLGGIAAATAHATVLGLTLIPGIELSCQWAGRGVHIVGLNIDPAHAAMAEAHRCQGQVRQQRAVRIAEKLCRQGIAEPLAGARALAGGGVVGRPHFARYLQQAGYVNSYNEAFKKYLGAGKAGDIKALWPDMATAIAWVRRAGGIAVLAHPHKYKLTRRKFDALLEEFRAGGGRAMEVISGRQQAQLTLQLAAMAQRHDLHVSCGSDFHVPDQPWQELGAFGELPSECRPVWALWGAA